MKYIIDIDGTICETPIALNGSSDYENAKPNQDRISKINSLYDQGHTIHYWTARGSATGVDRYELTALQLKNWGAKYHKFSVGKPSYDVWVDDKAVSAEDFFKN